MPVVCFSGMGAAHGFPQALKKNRQKNSRHWVTWVGKTPENTASVQMRRLSTPKRDKYTNRILQLPKLQHEVMKKHKGREVKRKKKQEVMISDWVNLCEGLTQSFSKLIINGALGSLTQKATFDWFSSAAHTATTHSQSKSSTISQLIKYERHSTKLVPKPAVTFQTNAVWLE